MTEAPRVQRLKLLAETGQPGLIRRILETSNGPTGGGGHNSEVVPGLLRIAKQIGAEHGEALTASGHKTREPLFGLTPPRTNS